MIRKLRLRDWVEELNLMGEKEKWSSDGQSDSRPYTFTKAISWGTDRCVKLQIDKAEDRDI